MTSRSAMYVSMVATHRSMRDVVEARWSREVDVDKHNLMVEEARAHPCGARGGGGGETKRILEVEVDEENWEMKEVVVVMVEAVERNIVCYDADMMTVVLRIEPVGSPPWRTLDKIRQRKEKNWPNRHRHYITKFRAIITRIEDPNTVTVPLQPFDSEAFNRYLFWTRCSGGDGGNGGDDDDDDGDDVPLDDDGDGCDFLREGISGGFLAAESSFLSAHTEYGSTLSDNVVFDEYAAVGVYSYVAVTVQRRGLATRTSRKMGIRLRHIYRIPYEPMSRQWMYGDRCHPEFITGMHYFLNVAEANRRSNGFMYCPCSSCKNMKDYPTSKTLHIHLLENGFMPSYNCWTKHGERGVILEDNEEEEDSDNYPLFTEDGDSRMGEDEAEEEPIFDEPIFDDPDDDLGRAILDAKMNCGNEKERLKLEKMLEDHNKLLYPNCENGQKKLGTTLELLQWKAENGTSDKGFEKLLKIIKKMLPGENVLPSSTYEAKKVVCPLGLEVQKIHACINDCILYRGEYENLNACPVCSALRYKIRRDDPGDVEGESTPRKRVPAKVMWYAPIIPRLKRLFQNKEHAKLLRWHKEDRKKDVMLRHPADGSQWRKIDREFKSFSDDARNLRFGLSTDGFNPFGEQSSSHSTWPVTLCIYNLPPWLCMKRKFIMMPVLIQGPKQPGNDIDVYLRPLVEELLELWRVEGVPVWDEHEQKEFNLRALLFVTINDWPALGNISGQSNKGYNACTHCLGETDTIYLGNKNVYLGHRRFLPKQHHVRKRGKHFGGEADNRTKPTRPNGEVIYDMVKDLKVIFGKGPGGQSVPHDVDGHVPMWKKKSIFWELPYWKFLEVHSAIDVMHVTKNVCVNLLNFLGVYGKTKDTPEARQDQQSIHEGNNLNPEKYQGPASYALTKEEKEIFFEVLSSIKVPSGFSSNIKGIINMSEKKFQNLKSHDCHVIMTQLLPVALRGLLPENVRVPIVKLCAFLNAISQKVINPLTLQNLQKDVVQCLVSFELVFPPSFFNIMTHLLVHLVEEIGVLGPVFLHNMFPFERFMGVLKKYVHNRARPEGSISKGYGTEEVIEFCVDFIPDLKPIGVPESRYEGRLRGKGTLGKKSATCMDGHSFTQAHYTVLLNSILVAPYKEEHKEILRSKYPEQREDWIDGEHMKTFGGWLQTRLMNVTDDEQLYLLAKQPSSTISTFQGYEINGNTFYTFAQDKKSTNQNSGVRFDAEDGNGNKVTYYGYIEEIWELDYGPNFKVPLFRCKWFNLKDGVQVDPQYGMTTVDFKNLGAAEESQWHPDYSPTWESFFINRRERALARHEEGGPPPPNFNEAGRRLWWRGRTLQGVMAYRGPRLRYPQSQPTRAHPPTFEYRDPDASDDDDGDYDDYSGDYYRARHEYD
ncbi:hypothetical protein QYE76_045937 [Lolium multiflorum]|uniref:Transposon protein, putative, CACTA, En/Spm sub-class n=1 Tax=Lolium multiflorum TaxID=4521 RepID=A0AAD8TL89_LOLMU|nr:hypothetical protein QYE76_045937 [Lolium multiflorum]